MDQIERERSPRSADAPAPPVGDEAWGAAEPERSPRRAEGNGQTRAKREADASAESGHQQQPERPAEEKRDQDQEQEGDAKPGWSTRKKLLVGGIIALVVIAAGIVALLWWLHARHYERTDDAFIDAHNEMVAPQVAGRILAVLVNDNDTVQAGQVLVRIEPSDYQVRVEQATAAVAEAHGKLEQAKAQELASRATAEQSAADVERAHSHLANAERELKRYEGLSAEAVSQQRLDDLRTNVRNATSDLRAAQKGQAAAEAQVKLAASMIQTGEANIKSAEAQLAHAQLQLSYTDVKATIGGRVANRQVQAGNYVQPGQQLMAVVPHEVWVTANYKETQLTDMRPGQPVDIAVDAFPDVEFHGKVDSIQAGAGAVFSLLPPQNATGNYVKVVQRVPVKITFDDATSDAYKRLGPGMSVMPSVKVR
jgi:membrane fusion protein (multidrug efflux system)